MGITALSLVLFAAGLAQGQVKPSASTDGAAATSALDELPLEQLVDIPVTTVQGVSKYKQSIRQAPADVTIYTAEDIRNFGWRTLADALRAAPGFHVRSDRFYDYLGNRGFTRPFDYNSRTLILIDGHRINDPIYQQGSIGTEFILDPAMIERIEIIRGPGSSLYGSGAFFGAINIVPRQGRDLAGGEAAVTVDSSPGIKGRLSSGNRTKAGVNYTVSATEAWSRVEPEYTLPERWRSVTGLKDMTAYNATDLRQRTLYGQASGKIWHAEAGFVRRKQEVVPDLYDVDPAQPSHGTDERAYLLGRVETEPLPEAKLHSSLSLDHYRYDGLFSPALRDPALVGTQFNQLHSYARSLSLNYEARWQQMIADRHIVLAGVEFQENFMQNLGRDDRTAGTSPARVRTSSRFISPFTQIDWRLLSSLQLSTGVRYDDYSTGERRTTPRLGLIATPDEATTIKLLYGESFRVPNPDERFAPENGFKANPDLRPETNTAWEVSLERRLNNIWSAEVEAWYMNSPNLIQAVVLAGTPTFKSYVNAQEIETQGVSLGLDGKFTSGLALHASATQQRSYDRTAHTLLNDAPRQLLKLRGSFPLLPRLLASSELQWVGDRRDPTGNTLEGYWKANLTLRARQLWTHWDVVLSAYNLGDDQGRDPSNENSVTRTPRSFALSVTRDF